MNVDLAVIGASLGGLHALEIILRGLPKPLPIALAIVQHRYQLSNGGHHLAAYLQQQTVLPVTEVEDKQPVVAGQIYLAPAGYHLLVETGHFALSTEAPVCYARPSIDVLFESAADAYAKRLIGIILTGASCDGAQGLAKISAYGGLAIVQDPATAESRMMPRAAITAVPTATVLPLVAIAPFLANFVASPAPMIASPFSPP